jgi:uncharacterized protein (DUF2062 family)
MGRNFLVLAATLLFFSAFSFVMGWQAVMHTSLPGDSSLWQTVGFVLLVGALFAAVVGVLGTMFGQVQRRHQEREERERRFGR